MEPRTVRGGLGLSYSRKKPQQRQNQQQRQDERRRQNQDARFVPKGTGRSGRYIIQKQSPNQSRPAKAGRYRIQRLMAGVCGMVMVAVAIAIAVCAWCDYRGCNGE
jgi:hypothetical protein